MYLRGIIMRFLSDSGRSQRDSASDRIRHSFFTIDVRYVVNLEFVGY